MEEWRETLPVLGDKTVVFQQYRASPVQTGIMGMELVFEFFPPEMRFLDDADDADFVLFLEAAAREACGSLLEGPAGPLPLH